MDTARADVGSMEASSGNALVEFHKLLALFETPEEWGECADVHGVREDGHEVVEDAGDFTKHGADPFGTLRDFDVEEFFDGQGKALLYMKMGTISWGF